ncbi:cell envelope biogenesis protein OmpA [Polaribacter vadi]|uniref:Cell envelope biogenesis protein OmpA n=1 Tax=Polaribacter vadi TaxID=1774273 RepID=A0A1B8U336_9FLAO|nr:OmpA family protein [Polaribacter vadi]AOW17358.1 cell envelope biogenesis protein OmpA [Polaribacter vadi]OBY66294.1 cell envelope biogenesis protein OmpA [Polaribacter vadi]
MKKIYLGAVFTLMSFFASAQDYDHWSIDIGGGIHQVGSTLSPGFSENIFGQGHIGYRYMFNEKFGLRLDLGYNSFTANEDSQPFTSNYYRASLEGVVNLGSVLKFHTWTNRFNLLAHGGVGAASLNITDPVDNGGDVMFAMNFGITPQFKLNNRFSLFLDFSSLIHFYQEDNFDGGPNSATRESNISLFNTSIGLNIALGKNKQSADFWRGEEAIVVNSELESIKNRLDTAEKEIQVLKTKESSPNKELIMTELDNRYVKKGETTYGDVVTSSNVDFIKELLNRGYVNVFFDINSTKIQKESLSSVNYLRQFLYDNPYVNASLIGFTDETGSEERNQTLSNNRAKAVFDMLVASGISPTRLSYGGVGEDKTMSKGARQLARKVTFKIN